MIVWDATCGVGADALALSACGHQVVVSDRDPFLLQCARANLARAGFPARALVADVLRPPVLADVLLVDPDRRPAGRREKRAERWSPPLSEVLRVARDFGGACVELAAAFDPDELPDVEGPHSLQWVSLDRELREVSLWLGDLAGEAPREVLAIDARGEHRLTGDTDVAVEPLDAATAGRVTWLADPDPAVIRAGLLGHLARSEGLAPLGPRLAFLGGDREPDSPLLTAWPVLGTAPMDRKHVRALLREHDIGEVAIRKRGHPDPAEVLAARLRGPGARRGHLAVARLEKGHMALLLGERAPADGSGGR